MPIIRSERPGIMPLDLLRNGDIEEGAKILYAELSAPREGGLDRKVSNAELAAMSCTAPRTITRWISSLKKYGFIVFSDAEMEASNNPWAIQLDGREDTAKYFKTKVYLMRNGDTDKYKIGYSRDPKKRAKALSNPVNPVSIVFTVNGGKKQEAILHERFRENHVVGEWFSFNKEQLSQVTLTMREVEVK